MNILFILALVVTLAWDPNVEQDLAGYKVYRSEQAGTYGASVASVNPSSTPTFVDSNVEYGKKYYYVLTATNMAGEESAHSNEVVANIPTQSVVYLKTLTDGAGHLWGMVQYSPFPQIWLDHAVMPDVYGRDIQLVDGKVYILGDTDSNWWLYDFTTLTFTPFAMLPTPSQPVPDKLGPIVRIDLQ